VIIVACLRDLRGAATVEYVIVLALVSAGASLGVIALGSQLLDLFRFQHALLLSPQP
jgi:Flp pilus assembly pilin Flp